MAGNMADNFEFDKLTADIKDTTWSTTTVSVTGGNSSGWSYPVCAVCNSTPCICGKYQPASVSSITIGDVDVQGLIDKLSICQVCGTEDCFVLCSVCVEAVKLARNRWLDEFRKEIDALAD